MDSIIIALFVVYNKFGQFILNNYFQTWWYWTDEKTESEQEPAKLKNFGQMKDDEQAAVIQLGWTAESWDLAEDNTPFETEWEELGRMVEHDRRMKAFIAQVRA